MDGLQFSTIDGWLTLVTLVEKRIIPIDIEELVFEDYKFNGDAHNSSEEKQKEAERLFFRASI